MLKSRKHVFWEALLITVVVFFLGLLIGIAYEGSRLDKINEYYTISEISLMDILALADALELSNLECEEIIQLNLDFADRIYEEAKLMEDYDSSGRIVESLQLTHKKYDLMRTFLWMSSMKAYEKCEHDFNMVVYLYEFNTRDLTKKATQIVWSKILLDLKHKKGKEIVLIPISEDSDLASLNTILKDFEILEYPVVIINNKHVIDEVSSVEELETYLT